MKQIIVRFSLLVMGFLMANLTFAQKFTTPADGFSHKKIAYFTLQDGTELSAFVDKVKRQKGLIAEIEVKDESGKKKTLTPEQIKHMYLPPSGFDKLATTLDKAYDAQKWNQGENINQEYIKEGYVYFEQAEVMLKKGKETLLLQLLNPAFCGSIKVFHDPYAQETTSVGIGGITMAGGDDKSYYVSKDGETAFLLKKKNYDETFELLYKDCSEFMKKYEKFKWSDFDTHVYEYAETCTQE